jgi:hypothetical protein
MGAIIIKKDDIMPKNVINDIDVMKNAHFCAFCIMFSPVINKKQKNCRKSVKYIDIKAARTFKLMMKYRRKKGEKHEPR